jgi:hypothetical protein
LLLASEKSLTFNTVFDCEPCDSNIVISMSSRLAFEC